MGGCYCTGILDRLFQLKSWKRRLEISLSKRNLEKYVGSKRILIFLSATILYDNRSAIHKNWLANIYIIHAPWGVKRICPWIPLAIPFYTQCLEFLVSNSKNEWTEGEVLSILVSGMSLYVDSLQMKMAVFWRLACALSWKQTDTTSA